MPKVNKRDIVEIKEERYPHKGSIMNGFWEVREVYGQLVYVQHIYYSNIASKKKCPPKENPEYMLFAKSDILNVW